MTTRGTMKPRVGPSTGWRAILVDHNAEPRVPTYIEFMNPVLDCLRKRGESATNSELLQAVIDEMELPPVVTELLHQGGPQTAVGYRIGWAKTYLKKDGLINNSQLGVWSLTQKGRGESEIDGRELAKRVQQMSPQRNQSTQEEQTDEPAAIDNETDDDEWQEELLRVLTEMDPGAFERFCGRLLRESGFESVAVTGRSGDGGIDGQGVIKLAGGMIGFPVYFQCKKYSGNVTSGAVRDFRGAMQGRGDRGLIITTGRFTTDAIREATRAGAPPIDLVDGVRLAEKVKELRLGVTVTERVVEDVTVDAEWFRGF